MTLYMHTELVVYFLDTDTVYSRYLDLAYLE